MSNLAIVLVVLAVLGWIAWRANRWAAVFVVTIRDGRAAARSGAVTGEFLCVVEELCQQHGIEAGEVCGLSQGARIRLWFSSRIPEGMRQQLRNWWVTSGWPSPVAKRRC
jgi:hypothetical protein